MRQARTMVAHCRKSRRSLAIVDGRVTKLIEIAESVSA
jgi:hypothetical protein